MKIGIDAISAIGRSGNSTYTKELATHLEKLDKDNDYFLFSFLHDWGKKTPLSFSDRKNWHEVHPYISRTLLPFDRVDIINDRLVRLIARLRGIDIFHFTNPLNFVSGSYATVATIHDLSTFHDTACGKSQIQNVYAKKIRKIAKESQAIIAVSEYTKKDIINFLGVSSEKITVIYEAASGDFFPDRDIEYIQKKFGVEKYLLYVGQLQPRKNTLNLLKAWSNVSSNYPDYKLLLVGTVRDKKYFYALNDAIARGSIKDSVVFADSVNIAQLRKLYSGARCFVYPSFFEGFGLPILEAMQCGTPVISSNSSSLQEVVGDAGPLVDPNNPEEIAGAIERVLYDDALHTGLVSRSLAQAKKFSWEKAAKETLAIYRKVV